MYLKRTYSKLLLKNMGTFFDLSFDTYFLRRNME
ncbi:hypothetical protein CoNPh10_CDS0141 [Staphylococcus phage S-CoN_Ph10]|nr:hypothetical protein CoNPh10_CDS0141 [Staphylococcus phage S-CoN_Ph10]